LGSVDEMVHGRWDHDPCLNAEILSEQKQLLTESGSVDEEMVCGR
jgi:hypothetical protein